MFRWNKARALMLRRYRIELATHTGIPGQTRTWPWRSQAPMGFATQIDCHCARGIGTMRKHRPGVCEKVQCGCKRYKRADERPADLRMLARCADELAA